MLAQLLIPAHAQQAVGGLKKRNTFSVSLQKACLSFPAFD
jgi:hypothetical protein